MTEAVHPICHRTLHATFTNAELARLCTDGSPPVSDPRITAFLGWIAEKPPDFHAPTRHRKRG